MALSIHHTKTRRRLALVVVLGSAALLTGLLWPASEPLDAPQVEQEQAEAPPDLMGAVVNRVGGRGIQGVEVTSRCDGAPDELIETSDQDGLFSFRGLPVGKCTVEVRRDGYRLGGPSAPRDFPVQIGVSEGIPMLRVELSETAEIQGSVNGPSGPLADVTLTLLYLEAPEESEVFSETQDALTGEDGTFALRELLPGRIQVLAEHAVYGFLETDPFYLRPGQTLSGMELSMVPTGTIVGRVTDLSLSPLEGAQVTLSGKGRGRSRSTLTDQLGFFQFERVLPGPAQVKASLTGYELQARDEFVVVQDVESEATLRMRPLEGVAGLVTTPNGAPAITASVYLRRQDGRWLRRPVATTDDDGRFFLPKPASYPVTLRATHPAHGPSASVLVTEADATVTLSLTPGGRVVGRLLTDQRQPVGTFTVLAQASGEDKASRRARRERERDDEGKFSLDSMPPGQYTLRLLAPGFLPVEVEDVEVRAGEVTDVGTLLCSSGGTAVGRMLDQATGEPVVGVVRVTFAGYGRRAEGAWARSDNDGYFIVDGLRDQRMTLRLSARGYDTKMVSGLQTKPGDELSLGDVYLQAAEDGRRRLQYSGVGAQLRRTRNGIQFMRIFDDSPAADSGVVPGTVIMSINGQSATDMDLRQAVELIRGETGTEIQLLVQQPGAAEPEPIVLERRDVVAS